MLKKISLMLPLCLMGFAGNARANDPKLIKMASDEWLPYVGTKAVRGYMIEVADAIFAEKGIKVAISELPWPRVLLEVKKGNLDAAPGMQLHQAPDFIAHNEALGVDEAAIFTLASKPLKEYKDPTSLAGKKLGLIKDYTYEAKLDEYIKLNVNNSKLIHQVHGESPYETLVPLLRAGRIDAVVANPSVFYYQLKVLGINQDEFHISRIEGSANKVYIGFSPANPRSKEFAATLNEGIIRLRKSGELAKILAKYGLKDWQ